MLNPFPILFLAPLAYFILRLFVGGILLYLGFKHFRYRQELKDVLVFSWFPYGRLSTLVLALSELLLGTLVLVGAYTQYTALVIMAMCAEMLIIREWFNHSSLPPKIFYLLLFACALSLFITGAGALAFDLPI